MSVYVSTLEATEIAKSLLKLNRTVSAKQTDEFLKGTRDLQPHELKLNGKAGWDSNLRVIRTEATLNNAWDVHSLSMTPHRGNITFYRCPKSNCGKTEPSSACNFQSRDLDMPNRCTHCKGCSSVRAWICQCDTPWYVCQGHRNHHNGNQEGRQQAPTTTSQEHTFRTGTKRKRPLNQDYEELTAHEARRARNMREREHKGKRHRDIVLDDGPGLKVPCTLLNSLKGRLWGNRPGSSSRAGRSSVA